MKGVRQDYVPAGVLFQCKNYQEIHPIARFLNLQLLVKRTHSMYAIEMLANMKILEK
jgi:hypothetical protein